MPLPQPLRLKKNEAITTVFKRGRRAAALGIALRYRFRGGGISRFAFVVSRKTAPKSVLRNTVRRRASEWIRKNASALAPGFDAVFIFQKEACGLPRREFVKAMDAVVRRTAISL